MCQSYQQAPLRYFQIQFVVKGAKDVDQDVEIKSDHA